MPPLNERRRAPLSRRTALGRLAALGSTPWAAAAWAQDDNELMGYAPRAKAPAGYPTAYATTVRAAEDEGQLSVHSTTDERVAAPLVADFQRLYPRVSVNYEDLNSTELVHRFIAENELGREAADVLWSSAMDQIMSLALGGQALAYESPERSHLPAWAQWQNRLWATTYEPIVFACHKPTLPESEAPRSHAALGPWLARAGAAANAPGSVVSYDIQKSGLGYFLAAQNAAADADAFWAAAQGLGASRARLLLTTDAMVRQIADGRARFGMNLLGAYTLAQAPKLPALGVIFPEDYTLVISRLLLINARAAHPNAARLWVDYVLSQRGQSVMASSARLHALRDDAQGEVTGAALKKRLGERARPVALGPELAAPLANAAYRDFILRWRAALGRPR